MSLYGTSANVPYQEEGDLVNNPRYQGQSAGTVPHGITGPQQESRYGAVPLSTGMEQHQQQYAGLVDPNARASQAGYGANPAAGYGSHQPGTEFGGGQPIYGGVGGQNTGTSWPEPVAPANARPYASVGEGGGAMDKLKQAVGMGITTNPNVNHPNEERGFGGGLGHQGGVDEYGNPRHHNTGVDQYGNPRREGVVDQLKDSVGVGPNSGYNQGHNQGLDQYGNPRHNTGVDEYGNPRREGVVDKMKDAAGVGPNSGYNQGHNQGLDQYGNPRHNTGVDQYGNPRHNTGVDEYGNPRREGVFDKMKDAAGVGPNSGYNQGQNQGVDQYGNPRHNTGVDEYGNPRREGVFDKVKDAAGVGPNSGYNQGQNQGLDQYGNPRHNTGVDQYGNPRHNTGVDEYGNPRREGVFDKMKDAAGVGPNTGYNQGHNQGLDQYGNPRHNTGVDEFGNPRYQNTGVDEYGNPRREGVVDKLKDAAGVGPNTGYNQGHNQGLDEYGNPRHHNQGLDEFGNPRHHNTGVDEYGNPRREGVVDKLKDAAGVGPNSGYDNRTRTGNDAYVHGNHPHGQQDRIQGVHEPTLLGGEQGVEPGFGRRDGVLEQGEHIPQYMMGERRTEPGYDMSKGLHLPGHNDSHTMGTGLGGHGVGDTHSQTGTGLQGHDLGERRDNEYGGDIGGYTPVTGHGHDGVDHTGTAPKKGIVTKIKEKLHHEK